MSRSPLRLIVLALPSLACGQPLPQERVPSTDLNVNDIGKVVLKTRSFKGAPRRQIAETTGTLTGLPGVSKGGQADPMIHTPSASEGLPTSGQAYPDPFVIAATFGLVCDGRADRAAPNTHAINLATAVAAGTKGTVILPAGTCVINPIAIPDDVSTEGQGQGRTTLLFSAGSNTGATIVSLGSFSGLRQLTIDGNKANHTAGSFGILGYRIQGARIEDVTVANVLGIGDGMSDSARVLHIRETVTGTQMPSALTGTSGAGNGSGFWTASYTPSSFYYDGGSQYVDCVSDGNDLDGLEFGSNNIAIIRGRYSNNGQFTDKTVSDQRNRVHSGQLGGALGAAGLYFAFGTAAGSGSSPTVALNTTIQGVVAYGNSESGFDLGLGAGSVVTGNVAHHNGTFGFLLEGTGTASSLGFGARSYALTGNHAYDNGQATNATWIAGNPTFMTKAGFGWNGKHDHVLLTGNEAYDDQATPTQQWGAYGEVAFTAAGAISFDSFTVSGNQFARNGTGAANFEGIAGAVPAAFTRLRHLDPHACRRHAGCHAPDMVTRARESMRSRGQ